jgi:hypothetical protein
VQQRSKDSPADVKLIISDKVAMISLDGIENQAFVCFGDLEVRETSPVREIKFSLDGLHAQAGELRVHLDVDRFIGLDTDNEFVAWNILEDARCDIFELNADLGLLLVESWKC